MMWMIEIKISSLEISKIMFLLFWKDITAQSWPMGSQAQAKPIPYLDQPNQNIIQIKNQIQIYNLTLILLMQMPWRKMNKKFKESVI